MILTEIEMGGWLFKITTKALTPGNEPLVEYYAVGLMDQAEAEKELRRRLGVLDEVVTAVAPKTVEWLKFWSIGAGDIRSIPVMGP